MNTYKKFCPNVYVAQCEQQYQKNDIIEVTTQYGKINKCIVHNFIGYTGTKEKPMYCYSITRVDGFNNQERAKNKIEKLNNFKDVANKKGAQLIEKSKENRDFLALGEPIKIGHHSEKRHRALIERNWNRLNNAMEQFKKAEFYQERLKYWEQLSEEINLSMPESLEFYKEQLDEATEYYNGLKKGIIPREHNYSLTYANKKVKDLTVKYNNAIKLWK